MPQNKKLNIFLDLDNTLIFSDNQSPENYAEATKHYTYDFIDPYLTIERPHLQTFLDYVFLNHSVGIWTAANKNYGLSIFNKFIKKYDPQKRKLSLFLFDTHCEVSRKETGCIKSLRLLWEKWKIEGFDANNTYIIDDLKEVYTCQKNNCLPIKEFKMFPNGYEDVELLKMIEKIKKLSENNENNEKLKT